MIRFSLKAQNDYKVQTSTKLAMKHFCLKWRLRRSPLIAITAFFSQKEDRADDV